MALVNPMLRMPMLEYGGPGGYERLSPEDEARMAMEARAAAVARMGGGGRGTADMSLFNDPQPQTMTQQLAPVGPFAGAMPQQPPAPQMMPMPAPINVPSLRVASMPDDAALPPNAQPTIGGPMPGMFPQQQAPQPMPGYPGLPQQSPDIFSAGLGDRLGAAFGNIGSAPTLGGALFGGLAGMVTGQRNLDAGAMAQMRMRATYDAVLRATGDPNKAILAATNPEAAKPFFDRMYGERKPAGTFEFGNTKIPYVIGDDGNPRMLIPGMGNGGQMSLTDLIGRLQGIEAEGKRRDAAATAGGKAQGEAAAALPNATAKADYMLDLIDGLSGHPGKNWSVGIGGLVPGIPGTPQADFLSRLDQLKGQTFLQAYEGLKGGGAISEVEGKKAEGAIARLQRTQSREAFDAALRELRDVVASARSRLGVSAGGEPLAPKPSGWNNVAPGIRIREVK
jgi:hypothetical protein